MSRPVAVLISDVHYSVHTLKLADAAMRQAINTANELKVPLIVAGDLHDTKANLRGECVSALIKTFTTCIFPPYILIGNHDRINEKDSAHSLEFLRAYANIVDSPLWCPTAYAWLLPYYHNSDECRADIKELRLVNPGANFIMHQGIEGSNTGDYIQDKSAISPEDVSGLQVISGHYHQRQTIKLLDGGQWDYIGNPYTTSYGEASDPPKGYQILLDNGSLQFIPTHLRKHVIWNEVIGQQIDQPSVSEGDLLWIKMYGTREQLNMVTKNSVPLSMPFRLDLIPTDTTTSAPAQNLSQADLLDSLIDSLTNTSDERKTRLKQSWKDLCE